jgi:hypothetical protein
MTRRELLWLAGAGGAVAAAGGLLAPGLRAGLSTALAQTVSGSSFDPVRPPAAPLAVRSMYLSTWLQADLLPGSWPTFWNGHTTALTGIVRVDGKPFVFCGNPSGGVPLATQTALALTATRSTYTLTAAGVTLTVTFFSPVDPQDLRRQSVPMSYVLVSARAADGGAHRVSVYLDISGEWAHGDITQPITWAQQAVGGLNALTVQPASPVAGLAVMNSSHSLRGPRSRSVASRTYR